MPISLHFTLDDQVTLGLKQPKTYLKELSKPRVGGGGEGIHTEFEFGKTKLLYYPATLNSKEQSVLSTRLMI